MSVQEIYFSDDEMICKDHLQSLSRGMLEEISVYQAANEET